MHLFLRPFESATAHSRRKYAFPPPQRRRGGQPRVFEPPLKRSIFPESPGAATAKAAKVPESVSPGESRPRVRPAPRRHGAAKRVLYRHRGRRQAEAALDHVRKSHVPNLPRAGLAHPAPARDEDVQGSYEERDARLRRLRSPAAFASAKVALASLPASLRLSGGRRRVPASASRAAARRAEGGEGLLHFPGRQRRPEASQAATQDQETLSEEELCPHDASLHPQQGRRSSHPG